MDDVLLNFIQILRRCGLRVSISESLDGAKAAASLGMEDRARFKAALRASLVKRTADIELFDEIFDAYFTDSPSDVPIEERFGRGLPQPGEGDEALDDALRRAMEQMGGMSELGQAMLHGNVQIITAEMLRHMSPEQLAELRTMMQRGQFVRMVLDKMGWEKVQEEMRQLIQQLIQQGDYEAAHRVRERLYELQELFPKWVTSEVDDAVRKQLQPERAPPPLARDVEAKPFEQYSEREIEEMESVVDQMARRLREEWARRTKRGGSRRFDAPRTQRAAMSTFGVPMALHWKQRRRNRLNLVLLCDVSSSVRHVSRFMLQLVYSLQQQRGRIRSFVFIADLAEVSESFEKQPIDEAVRIATSEAGITYWAHSDFGRAFRTFLDEHGDVLGPRTTVIILGDGRCNFYDPQLDALREIRSRSRRVIWLNPEDSVRWSWGDSWAYAYAQLCDRMVEVGNLAQLRDALDTLIREGA